MTRTIGLLYGLLLGIASAMPAQAIEGDAVLGGREKIKVSGCGSDQAEGSVAMTFDASSLRTLFTNLTFWAGDICGIPVRILSARQSTFTGKFAKGKAKGTIRFTFVGIALDGTLGTATWAGKYQGGFVPTLP